MNFGTIFTLSSLKAVYTYDSESYSLSDLHANRMPIQLSVRFPFPILEIIDELKKWEASSFGKLFTTRATGNRMWNWMLHRVYV
jgi:hypothetical protein